MVPYIHTVLREKIAEPPEVRGFFRTEHRDRLSCTMQNKMRRIDYHRKLRNEVCKIDTTINMKLLEGLSPTPPPPQLNPIIKIELIYSTRKKKEWLPSNLIPQASASNYVRIFLINGTMRILDKML